MTATDTAVPDATLAPTHHRRPAQRTVVVALGGWAALLVVARVWGLSVARHATSDLFLGAMPMFGRWHWSLGFRLVPAVVVAVALVVALPTVTATWSWRRALLAVATASMVWGLALAYVDSGSVPWTSIHDDYGQHIGRIDEHGLGAFLRDYVDDQATFPTHLQAHPPGMVVLLWAADRVELHGHAFESLLALAGAATAAVAALVALREVADAELARRAAPFAVLAPAAVWHTNADALFAGVSLVGVAFVVIATGRTGRRADSLALSGGLLFGVSLLLSYGVALLALPMVAVAVWRRRLRPLVFAGLASASLLLLPAAWGFAWLAGLAATKHQYDVNLALLRPYRYFVVANLAVFALAVGPATIVGLCRLRDRAALVLVGAGLAVVLVADLTGLSSAETERIWQPFMPLVLLAGAAAALPSARRGARGWLGVQAATALVLQAALRSPW